MFLSQRFLTLLPIALKIRKYGFQATQICLMLRVLMKHYKSTNESAYFMFMKQSTLYWNTSNSVKKANVD